MAKKPTTTPSRRTARPVAAAAKSAVKSRAGLAVAKSAAKPAKGAAVARSAVKAPPKAPARPVAKAPARPAARPSLNKASLAKKPATKSSGSKLPPLKAQPVKAAPAKSQPAKPQAKKAIPVKAPAPKAKPAAPVAEAGPATEEQIMGAVSGKFSSTRNAAGGFSWLGGSKGEAAPSRAAAEEKPAAEVVPAPAPEAVAPVSGQPAAEVAEVAQVAEVTEAVGAPALETEPAAPEPEILVAPVLIESTDAPVVVEETVTVTVIEPGTSPTAEETLAAAEESGGAPEAAAPVSALPEPIVPARSGAAEPAEDHEEATAKAFQKAGAQLGGWLTVQAVVFLAFCVLIKGGVPQAGLPHFLVSAIPLFAMILAAAAIFAYASSQHVLDRLEAGRPDLTAQRKAAHRPAHIILFVLAGVWFFIGAAVWFL